MAPPGGRPEWRRTGWNRSRGRSTRRRSTSCRARWQQVDWNAELVHGDLARPSAAQAGAGQGAVRGGVTASAGLAELGLIDEYEFVVHPRLVGHGPTLFAGLSAGRPEARRPAGARLGRGRAALRAPDLARRRAGRARWSPWAAAPSRNGVWTVATVWEVLLSGDPAGAGVVDDVGGSVGVAPDVDAGEGLFHLPVAVGLDAVVEGDHRSVVPDPGELLPGRAASGGPGAGVVDLHWRVVLLAKGKVSAGVIRCTAC